MFVRSVSMQKGVLFDVAQGVKNALLAALEKAELSPGPAQELLASFFGPNSNSKLAIKRNQDLLKVLC